MSMTGKLWKIFKRNEGASFDEDLARYLTIFGLGLIASLVLLAVLVSLFGKWGTLALFLAAIGLTGYIYYLRHRPPRYERQPKPPKSPVVASPRGVSTRTQTKSVSNNDQQFYGQGTMLQVPDGDLVDPMIYYVAGRLTEKSEPSTIESALPVNLNPDGATLELPYWPNYRDMTPPQRGVYQRWLVTGRRNPDIAIGYVFVYFYGLERRLLVDQKDYAQILREISRLLSIYSSNRSFRRYALTLFWLGTNLMIHAGKTEDVPISEVLKVEGRWDEQILGLCLSVFNYLNLPVPSTLALRLAENDPRSVRSVVKKRHSELFRKLFRQQYKKQYPDRMTISRVGKRPLTHQYQAASSALNWREDIASSIPELPNVLAIGSQFKPLVEIWNRCIEELKQYDKTRRKSSSGDYTTEAYEALPAALRHGDHPEFDQWWAVKESYTGEDGWTFVPVSALAQIKGISERSKLTLPLCRQLLQTADALGFGVEPDARVTRRSYRWNEKIALFVLDGETGEERSPGYLAAATLLRLGLVVAEADGSIDHNELDQITRHLEDQFELSDTESVRLEHLERMLTTEGAGFQMLTQRLVGSLDNRQLRMVGGFLIGVAAADGVITAAEHDALTQLFKKLGIPDDELNDLLHSIEEAGPPEIAAAKPGTRPGEPIPGRPQQKPSFTLDKSRVQAIMGQTAQVAAILSEAMSFEDDEEVKERASVAQPVAPVTVQPQHNEVATPPAPLPVSITTTVSESTAYEGLDPRYHGFLDAVTKQGSWTGIELRELADRCGVMPNGAIDKVNEWAMENLGDMLIDGDTNSETVLVETELLGSD